MNNIIQFPIDRVTGGQKTFLQVDLLPVPKKQWDRTLEELEAMVDIDIFEQDQLIQRGIVDNSDQEANRPNIWQKWYNKGKIV